MILWKAINADFTEADPQVGTNATNFYSLWNGTQLATGRIFDNGSEIGIGTTVPGANGHIYENLVTTAPMLRLQQQNAGGDVNMQFVSVGVTDYSIGIDASDAGKFKISNNLVLGTTDRFVIDNSGNVGIGLSSPTDRLHVSGTIRGTTIISTTTVTAQGDFITTSGDYTYFNPKTRYLHVPLAAFRPFRIADLSTYLENFSSGNLTYSYRNVAFDGFIVAPIYLPDGARITEISFFGADGTAADMTLTLQYQSSSSVTDLQSVTSTNATNIYFTGTLATAHTVNNQNNAYFLRFQFTGTGTSLRFNHARVTYEVDQAD